MRANRQQLHVLLPHVYARLLGIHDLLVRTGCCGTVSQTCAPLVVAVRLCCLSFLLPHTRSVPHCAADRDVQGAARPGQLRH
jgi:hypothetical protein